jgi:hypothetical protein
MKKFNKMLIALATFGMAVATGAVIGAGSNKAQKANAVTSGTEAVTLSSGVYNSTAGTVTWDDTYATITQAKITGGSNVGNYTSAPRLYKGNYLRFEAKTGVTISSVVITYTGTYTGTDVSGSSSSTANGSTPTNVSGGNLTQNTTNSTYTYTLGSDIVSVCIGNALSNPSSYTQLRPSAISFGYVASSIPPSFSLSKNELNLAIGGAANTTVTSTSANFTGTVTYSVAGADAAIATATIDAATGTLTITPSATATAAAEETLTVTATDGTTTLTDTIHVTIGLPYSLITDSTGIKPGKVIIANVDGTYAATKTVTNNKITATTTLAGTNTIYSTPSVDEYVLGLAPVKDQYTLATSEGKYIYGYVSGTYYDLATKTTLDSDCYWSIAVTSGVAVITGQSSTANGGTLEYYSQNFAFYSGTNNLHLYSVSSTELSSIAIAGTAATQPVGAAPDTTGLTVTATFADSTTADVTAWATWTPAAIAADTTALTASVTIGGVTKTANIACTVKTATLVSIAVTTQPTKTTYDNGEALDLTGIVVTGTYDDSSTLDVTSSATYSTANGTALTTAGTNTITVTVDTKTATFSVTVNPTPFHTLKFATTTDGFASATTSAVASFESTKEIDSNRWTMRATGAVAGFKVYAASTAKTVDSVSYNAEQIGSSSYPATSLSIRSGIIKGATNSEVKITKVNLYMAGAATTSAATISCKIGFGSTYTTCATTGTLSGNTNQKFSFEFATGAYGHIQFDFASIAKGLVLIKADIIGAADDSDTGVAYELAHRVEMADGCTTATLSTLYTGFQDDLSQFSTEATNTFNAITIDEAPDKTTTVATADLCTTAVKLAAMNARIAAASGSVKLAVENEATASTAIVLIAFAAIIGCGAYLYIRRRKQA